MLYIFNSGRRELYKTNVLNTLALPSNHTNRYRYRIRQNLTEELAEKLQKMFLWKPQVAIIFIDRYATGGYVFHPIRLAKFKSAEIQSDQLHITVKLTDYIYPKNIKEFNTKFISLLADKNLPELTNGDTNTAKDGLYVIEAPNIFKDKNSYLFGEPAWTEEIDKLKDTIALKSLAGDYFCFLKYKLQSTGWFKRDLTPDFYKGHSAFTVLRNNDYNLSITYKFPIQNIVAGATAKLLLESDELVKWTGVTEVSIDSFSNHVPTSFHIKRYTDDNDSKITFSPGPKNHGNQISNLHLMEIPIILRVRDTKFFWFQSLIALFIVATCSVIIATDLSKLTEVNLGTILESNWLKIIAGIFQALGLLWLFKLFGKKLL